MGIGDSTRFFSGAQFLQCQAGAAIAMGKKSKTRAAKARASARSAAASSTQAPQHGYALMSDGSVLAGDCSGMSSSMHEAFLRAVLMMATQRHEREPEMDPAEEKSPSEHGSLSAETLVFGGGSPEREDEVGQDEALPENTKDEKEKKTEG